MREFQQLPQINLRELVTSTTVICNPRTRVEGGWELQFTPPFPENPENPEDSGGEFRDVHFDAQASKIRRFGPEKVVHI